MLRYIGETEAANRMENAIAGVIAEGKVLTYDLKRGSEGKAASTMEVAQAVKEKLT